MEYSKIRKVRVRNFRCIGDVELDFTKSPIISLVGSNEAGKTSIVKALAVGGMNAYSTRQKKYIKTGTPSFDVDIELEDGSTVQRHKTATINRLTVYNAKTDKKFETDKIDRGEGQPQALQEVMGLVEEPDTKEFLQIRTYEDNLLFVTTPTSTNYKVFYEALKVSNLTNAIKRGNTEALTLKNTLAQKNTELSYIKRQLEGVVDIDTESLQKVYTKLQKAEKVVSKLEQARCLSGYKMPVKALDTMSQVSTVDKSQCRLITKAMQLHLELQEMPSELKEPPQQITVPLRKLQRAIQRKREVTGVRFQEYTFPRITKDKALVMSQALKRLQGLVEMLAEITELETELQGLKTELDKMTEGHEVKKCPRCGEVFL